MFKPLKMLATLLVGLSVLAAAPAMAQPAMWVIKDEDSTIYLFGTVHILKPETEWKTEKYEKALASAEEVWLEINDSDDTAAVQSLVMTLGMDKDHPLSSKLTGDEYARVETVATQFELPMAALNVMKPWLASITLTVYPMMKAGYDPTKGVDNVVKASAQAADKPVRAFETSEQQLRFFDSLPQQVQVEFLMSSLDDIEEGPGVLDTLVDNWAVANLKAIESDMVTPMREEYPELYKVLLIDRNVAWADVLADRMKGKGVSFVAVGSAHLVGPDSVQVYLAKKGFVAERY